MDFGEGRNSEEPSTPGEGDWRAWDKGELGEPGE